MDGQENKNKSQPNRLIDEKSPYLQQHDFNPVNWYPWGDEPFEIAKRENKPLFLSIGYSTCHWCHVMERESFESEAIAQILNDHFISIKVDREERPDIDQLYILATQAMTGSGGWPMSVFLFPNGKPFYAGTYFPPVQRFNQPGFPDLLLAIQGAWSDNQANLTESADKITDFLEGFSNMEAIKNLDPSWSDAAYQFFQDSYDSQYHGFGEGNKFPRPSCFEFLLSYSQKRNNENALAMSRDTLRAMAMGGMYDHLGGGFHRYSVDKQWRVPHFEKMLYDQAQLTVTYLQMYQLSGEDFFANVAKETIDYVLRDLQHEQGGIFSAEDADSVNPYNPNEHGEGAFYLWKESEIREILDNETAEAFITCYGIRPHGNALNDPAGDFTGRNIPYIAHSAEETAEILQKDIAEVSRLVAEARIQLLHIRNKRVKPHLDDKILTSWDGLMISALAQAGRILDIPAYLNEGKRVAEFILTNLRVDNQLLRRWRDGEARFAAVLDDYAFFVQGLLDLHMACQEKRYLETAIELSHEQLRLFADPAGGFFSSQESAGLLTRIKETYDGAEPAGNSVSALNFLRLGRLLDKSEWIEIAEKTIKAFGKTLAAQGSAMPLLLKAMEILHQSPQQLIICGSPDNEDTQKLLRTVNSKYLPALQILLLDDEENYHLPADSPEYISNMKKIDGRATAYLCTNYSCNAPVNEPEELLQLLSENT